MSKQSFSVLEGVITAGALVTSAAAVYIAWDQAQVMHTEQHAQVFPAIQIDPIESYTNGDGVKLGFVVENAGVGPAFIGSARLLANDAPLNGYEEISSLVPSGVDIDFQQLTGRVVSPGDSREAMTLHWRDMLIPTAKLDRIYASTDGWKLEVCYCSTLDRCWISTSGSRTHPARIEACPANNDTGLF